jgi:hypothetical protein
MGSRSSGGLGAVLGFLLLLGLVIQVVKLLVVPLTILAVGAVVTVPIYLITKARRNDEAESLPAVPQTPASSEDDGLISHDGVLQLLPRDIASALSQGQHPEVVPTDPAPDPWATHPGRSVQPQRPARSGGASATVHRHGSCPIEHRSPEAAARCRNA